MAGPQSYSDSSVLCVCTKRQCCIFVAILGTCLALGGIIGLIVSPIATKMQVDSRIPLTENSYTATQWIDPPYNITMQFWLFNTTNADEVLAGSEKPSVTEKGPYTYTQKTQKNQVKYGDDDNVFFFETNVFYFDEWRSCKTCKESDVFTLPNAIYTTVAQVLRFKDDDTKRVVNLALLLLGERPFVTKPVSELIFNGFEDQVVILANMLSFLPLFQHVDLPKVAQYFPKNNTNDGRYEVCVGKNDVKKMGSILSWNGRKNMNWWSTDEANKIEGTDAQIFPPYINRGDKLPIFVSDLCRSANLEYSTDTYVAGFHTYRYIMSPEMFDTSSEKNKGFCSPTDQYYPSQANNYSCLPAGLMNLTACSKPMVLSMPHFLHAAEEVVNSIDGINPTSDHEMTWDIQPTFGAAVAVNTKFQLNAPMHPDPIFWSIKEMQPVIIPLFWFNASAHIDPFTKNYLYTNIVVYQTVGYAVTFAVLLFGVLVVMLSIVCCYRYRSKKARWDASDGNNAHVNRALIEETEVTPGNNWSTKKV